MKGERDLWEELSKLDMDNKEKYVDVFIDIISNVMKGNTEMKIGEREEEDHFLVIEEDYNGFMINIIPKQAYQLFKKMKEKHPKDFLGYSVLCGQKDGRDVRVSCFGIPCTLLSKALIRVKE